MLIVICGATASGKSGLALEIAQRLDNAEIDFSSQQGISCCGSHSNKHWVLDPQGIAWESFRTLSTSPMFDEHKELIPEESSACCIPLHLI